MAKALLIAGTNNTLFYANSASKDTTLIGALNDQAASTGKNEVYFGVAGTLTRLAALVGSDGGTGRTTRTRINAAFGTLIISPTNATAGFYEDTTNSDAVAAGNPVHLRSNGTATGLGRWARALFAASAGHATIFSRRINANYGAAINRFVALNGIGDTNAVEANAQVKMRVAGTLKNAYVHVTANTSTFATTFTLRVNGVDTAVVVTVAAGATGLQSDTTHTAAIADGDLVCWHLVTAAGSGTFTAFVGPSIAFVATSGAKNDLFAQDVDGGTTRAASATPDFWALGCELGHDTTEANVKVKHGFAVNTSRLRIYISANTYTAACTVTLRKNGAAGNQTISIAAGATGWFEDTTHTDSFTATDDADVSIVGGTSGSITLRAIGITEEDAAAATTDGVGAAAGTGAAAAVGAAIFAGVGSAAGTGTASGTATGIGVGVGSAAGIGAAAAVGTGINAAVGSAAGTGDAAAVGAVAGTTTSATAAAAGTGVATGVGAAIFAGVGAASGAGTAAATGVAIFSGVGAAAGTGVATAVGARFAASTGAASGVGVAAANGIALKPATAAAAGVGVATAVGSSFAASVGNAAGVGTATAVGQTLAAGVGVGVATGTGTAAAVGSSTAASVAAAAGTGVATAVGRATAASIGAASGVGVATAVGASLAASVGNAAGFGAAFAVAFAPEPHHLYRITDHPTGIGADRITDSPILLGEDRITDAPVGAPFDRISPNNRPT